MGTASYTRTFGLWAEIVWIVDVRCSSQYSSLEEPLELARSENDGNDRDRRRATDLNCEELQHDMFSIDSVGGRTLLQRHIAIESAPAIRTLRCSKCPIGGNAARPKCC